MSSHHVLLLGGHGKVAQYLTPLLLQRSWTVTSVIRSPDQVQALKKLGENQPGKLDVLVRSLEEVKSDAQAKSLIDEVKPDYIVWSAGAGGKGGPERVGRNSHSIALATP
jgi:nucleoside-diphosphate-sugar epimerase